MVVAEKLSLKYIQRCEESKDSQNNLEKVGDVLPDFKTYYKMKVSNMI